MLFFQSVQNTKPFCFTSKYFIKIISSCFVFSQLYISSLQRVYIQKRRYFHNNSILNSLPKKEKRTNTFSLTFKPVCKNILRNVNQMNRVSIFRRYMGYSTTEWPYRRKQYLLITCNLRQQLILFHWVNGLQVLCVLQETPPLPRKEKNLCIDNPTPDRQTLFLSSALCSPFYSSHFYL